MDSLSSRRSFLGRTGVGLAVAITFGAGEALGYPNKAAAESMEAGGTLRPLPCAATPGVH